MPGPCSRPNPTGSKTGKTAVDVAKGKAARHLANQHAASMLNNKRASEMHMHKEVPGGMRGTQNFKKRGGKKYQVS